MRCCRLVGWKVPTNFEVGKDQCNLHWTLPCRVHKKTLALEMFMKGIPTMHFKITNFKSKQHIPVENEIIWPKPQGKSEGFDCCDRPSNLTQIGFKSSTFQPVWPWNLLDDLSWKTIGHAFFIMSSFVHRFKSIGEFKLELQSGNTQFRSKSAIFLSGVTLKFDGRPWKTIGHLF